MKALLRRYPRVSALLFGTGHMVLPRKLDAIIAGLDAHAARLDDGPAGDDVTTIDMTDPRKPYSIADGVATIDVKGALVHRAGMLDAMCGLSSYEALSGALKAALADSDVGCILLAVDSPGGQAAGAFDFADQVFAARKTKPIVAIAEDMACSAAYLIASSASECYLTQSGEVGSIGVVQALLDRSGANAQDGIKITRIYAGARKVDGNPDEPLTDPARAALQAEVNTLYDIFAGAVARNRGMTVEAVKATEAGTFIGAKGVTAGLADGVTTVERLQSDLALRVRKAASVFPPTPDSIPSSLPLQNDDQTQEIPIMATPADKQTAPEMTDADREELAALRAKEKAEAIAKRNAVVEKHSKRLSPATLAAMKDAIEPIKDADKLDSVLAKLPTEINPTAKGVSGVPAAKDGEQKDASADPQDELLEKAIAYREKNKATDMRGAINHVLRSDKALAARVAEFREATFSKPGPLKA